MTEMQLLRMERRRLAEERRRRELVETIKGWLLIVVMILAFTFAGTLEYEDRVRDLTGEWPSAEQQDGSR